MDAALPRALSQMPQNVSPKARWYHWPEFGRVFAFAEICESFHLMEPSDTIRSIKVTARFVRRHKDNEKEYMVSIECPDDWTRKYPEVMQQLFQQDAKIDVAFDTRAAKFENFGDKRDCLCWDGVIAPLNKIGHPNNLLLQVRRPDLEYKEKERGDREMGDSSVYLSCCYYLEMASDPETI